MEKHICAECVHWEMGDTWGSGNGKHGVLIESKGWCLGKTPNKRKRWNYCPACNYFIKRKMQGFFHMGGGGNTLEEDLYQISLKLEELMEDNKIEN